METVDNLLRDATAIGLRLYLKDGVLRGTPASIAPPELRDRITALKPQLIAHLHAQRPIRAATDYDRAVFAAWDEHLGCAPLTVDGLIADAAKYRPLWSALFNVAGSLKGLKRERLAAYLQAAAGVTINDRQIIIDGKLGDDPLWRIQSGWHRDLTAKQARARELFDSREDPA